MVCLLHDMSNLGTKQDVAIALKNTPKGQLSYDSTWNCSFDSLQVCQWAVSLKADRTTAQSGDHDCTHSIVVRSCCTTALLSTCVQSSVRGTKLTAAYF